MRWLITLTLASLLVVATATPGGAKMASIQTTAPLQDHGDQSVKNAVLEAMQSAVTGAMAMGLPWVQLRRAVVLQDAVAVQILATDADPEAGPGEPGEEDPEPESGLSPGATDDSSQTEL